MQSPFTPWLSLLAGYVLALTSLPGILGYKKGAPVEQCDGMTPGHYGADYRSALESSPFQLNASLYVYGKNQPPNITVTISTNPDEAATLFKGFMLQARNENDTRVGTFSLHPDSHLQLLTCDGEANGTAVTHTRNISEGDGVSKVMATWTAPDHPVGNVTFKATVVEKLVVVYTDLLSDPITWREGGDSAAAPLRAFSSSSFACLSFVVALWGAVKWGMGWP